MLDTAALSWAGKTACKAVPVGIGEFEFAGGLGTLRRAACQSVCRSVKILNASTCSTFESRTRQAMNISTATRALHFQLQFKRIIALQSMMELSLCQSRICLPSVKAYPQTCEHVRCSKQRRAGKRLQLCSAAGSNGPGPLFE